MRPARLPSLLLSVLLACASGAARRAAAPPATSPTGPVAAEPIPPKPRVVEAPVEPGAGAMPAEQIRAAIAREQQGLSARRVEGGGMTATVDAAGSVDVEERAEGIGLTIPIGTEQPVRCTVVPHRIEAGATLFRLVQGVKARRALLFLRPTDVVIAAGSPLALVELAYEAEEAGDRGKRVGQLEVAVYPNPAHSFVCAHDEPGYSATFRRVVTGLAGTLAGGAPDLRGRARWQEISVSRVEGVPIGFSEDAVHETPDGLVRSETWTAEFIPRSRSDLVGADRYSEEVSDREGLQASGHYVELEGGELESEVTLTRGADGRTYAYSATLRGKPISGRFETKAGLAAEPWFQRRFDAAHGYGPAGDTVHEVYLASASPTAPVSVTYRKEEAGSRKALVILGSMTFTGTLDEHGLFPRVELSVGPSTIVDERAWSRGTP